MGPHGPAAVPAAVVGERAIAVVPDGGGRWGLHVSVRALVRLVIAPSWLGGLTHPHCLSRSP